MNIDWANQPDIYYRKIIRKDNEEVSLDADMIRLLIAIDETKSLFQLAEEVGMGNSAFKKTLSRLLDQGLIEPIRKDVPVLNETFMESLKISLSRAIGPIAEILIEDAAEDMQLTVSMIPVHQAAELITHLSLEIPDENTRIQFKKSMIAILNEKRS
jgi:hypothetical protein